MKKIAALLFALFLMFHFTEETRLYYKDFSVALYECDESVWWTATAIVDAEDSAVIFQWCGSKSPIIADHCNQGFDIIKECKVGDICYINEKAYVCVLVDGNAVNERTDMFLSTGESFMKNNKAGYLYMYTCNEVGSPEDITVVVWKPQPIGVTVARQTLTLQELGQHQHWLP